MPRGVFERRPRVWIDENGVEQQSFGRPSLAEQKAKLDGRHKGILGEKGAEPKVYQSTVKPKDVEAEPPNFSEKSEDTMDVAAFIAAANLAVASLKDASDLTNHPLEKKYIGYFAKIIEEQMLPKYLKPHIHS